MKLYIRQKVFSWRDKFAVKDDRRFLMLDAVEREREAGVLIKINNAMRRYIYGY